MDFVIFIKYLKIKEYWKPQLLGDCLLHDMQKNNGSFYSKYDPFPKKPVILVGNGP